MAVFTLYFSSSPSRMASSMWWDHLKVKKFKESTTNQIIFHQVGYIFLLFITNEFWLSVVVDLIYFERCNLDLSNIHNSKLARFKNE